jgi:tetratricopeptide (TPR) repeat protein
MKQYTRLLTLCLLLFSAITMQGQKEKLPYFSNISPAEKDSLAKYYRELSVYLHSDPKKSFVYATQIRELGEKTGNRKLSAFGLVKSGIVLTHLHNYNEALMDFSLAIEVYEEMKLNKELANAKNMKALAYKAQGKTKEAEELIIEAQGIFEKENNQQGISDCQHYLGAIAWQQANNEKALEHYKTALELRKKYSTWSDVAGTLRNIALVYKDLSDYAKSREYLRQAMGIYKENNDTLNIASTLNQIGSVFWQNNKYNEALKYYKDAYFLRQLLGNPEELAKSSVNIANSFKNLGNTDSALVYYQKSLDLYQDLGYKEHSVSIYNKIGSLYLGINDYVKAIDFYNTALEYTSSLGNSHVFSETYKNIATFTVLQE